MNVTDPTFTNERRRRCQKLFLGRSNTRSLAMCIRFWSLSLQRWFRREFAQAQSSLPHPQPQNRTYDHDTNSPPDEHQEMTHVGLQQQSPTLPSPHEKWSPQWTTPQHDVLPLFPRTQETESQVDPKLSNGGSPENYCRRANSSLITRMVLHARQPHIPSDDELFGDVDIAVYTVSHQCARNRFHAALRKGWIWTKNLGSFITERWVLTWSTEAHRPHYNVCLAVRGHHADALTGTLDSSSSTIARKPTHHVGRWRATKLDTWGQEM